MILYLDATTLLERYLHEGVWGTIDAMAAKAEAMATCRTTLVEAASELLARPPWGRVPRGRLRGAFAALAADWDDYVVVEPDERRAADLVWKHDLRGFRALHIAAAEVVTALAAPHPVAFASSDRETLRIARAEGLRTLDWGGR